MALLDHAGIANNSVSSLILDGILSKNLNPKIDMANLLALNLGVQEAGRRCLFHGINNSQSTASRN